MSDADDFEKHVQAIEAMAKRLSDAASVFREAGLILRGGGVVAQIAPRQTLPSTGHAVAPTLEPYPCQRCGRKGPKPPAEVAGDEECLMCGNPMPLQAGQPGVVMTNKGPMILDPNRRAQLVQQPAFGPDGEPIA